MKCPYCGVDDGPVLRKCRCSVNKNITYIDIRHLSYKEIKELIKKYKININTVKVINPK